jgi:outer membrane receptor for ferrienterochelin and colicins
VLQSFFYACSMALSYLFFIYLKIIRIFIPVNCVARRLSFRRVNCRCVYPVKGTFGQRDGCIQHRGSFLERNMILKAMTQPSRAGKPTRSLALGAFSTLAISVALSIGMAPGQVYAQSATQVQIQSQPLAKALLQLGEQASLQIFFAQEIVEGVNAPTISGNLTADQALTQLLQGTGITFSREGTTVTLAKAGVGASNATTLGTVVVTASGFEQQIKDAPASISVITQEDLANKAYKDVNDALKNVPGVIVTGGAGREDISLRGMGSQYTLIMIDGKRQSSRETRTNSDSAGVEGGWSPPISAIERIEVVRGPMSSLYGSDAIGGVINIITRKVPDSWHGELRADTVLQESSKSGNSYQGNFYIGGPIKSDLLGLQVYGKRSKREEDAIISGVRQLDSESLTAKLALTPNKDHDIVFETTHEKQTHTTSLNKTIPLSSIGCARCNQPGETEYVGEKYGLSHIGRWGFGVSNTYVQRETFDNRGRLMKITNTNADTSWTLPVLSSNMLTVGASYLKQELTDQNGNQLATGIKNIDRSQWALFAENEWRVSEAFALTVGARYDNDENFGDHVSPRIYGVWHADDHWTVKGGVSTGFRSPELRQTVRGWGQVSRGGNMYGNPDLKPEKSVSQEIGVIYDNQNGFNASAMIFNNDFKDKITRVTCPSTVCTDGPNQFGANPTTYVNVDNAITRGIELTTNWQMKSDLSLAASYTYTKSEQKSGQYAGLPLNKLPKHMFSTTVNWSPVDDLKGWARMSYRGEESQPTSGASSSTVVAPSSTFVDLGGSYAINKITTLYAGIYNLLDKQITYESYEYVEDGRRYWLGLGLKF